MRVVIALNSFKSCLSAEQACRAVESGVKKYDPRIETEVLPISDGSEGFIDAITPTLLKRGYMRETLQIPDNPYNYTKSCALLHRGDRFILEMASICGQRQISEVKLNPYSASSYPLGLVLKELIRRGGKLIKLGLGACATHDLGIGMLSAMGCYFYDKDGSRIDAKNPSNMRQIKFMDSAVFDELTANCRFEICYDMPNPLFGPTGATYSFAMQKGASRQDLPTLEKLLTGFYDVLAAHFGRDVRTEPGTGSAGGIGAALLTAAKDSQLYPGFDFVVDLLHLDKRLSQCDLLLTGEGALDEQDVTGKSTAGLLRMAREHQVPDVALCGMLDKSADGLYQQGLSAMFSICNKPMTKTQSIVNAASLLSAQAYNVVSLFNAGKQAALRDRAREQQ